MLTFSRCTKELSAGLFMRILDQMFNEILSLPFPMDRGHTQHHSIIYTESRGESLASFSSVS